jgi:hypothetical protein
MEIVRKLLGGNCNGELGSQKSGLDDWKLSILSQKERILETPISTICEYEEIQRILPPFDLIPSEVPNPSGWCNARPTLDAPKTFHIKIFSSVRGTGCYQKSVVLLWLRPIQYSKYLYIFPIYILLWDKSRSLELKLEA